MYGYIYLTQDLLKNKISASNLGKNVGDKNGTFGKPAWNRGVGMSKEWREKLSEAKKGRV